MRINELTQQIIEDSYGVTGVDWLRKADVLIQDNYDDWNEDIPEWDDLDEYVENIVNDVPSSIHSDLLNAIEDVKFPDSIADECEEDLSVYRNDPTILTRHLLWELFDDQTRETSSDYMLSLHVFLENYLGKQY